MHVLEHSDGVGRHLHTDVFAHALVPGLGQVGEVQPAGEHRPLELEPHQHVQVIGELVRLHAHQRRAHLVHRAVEVVRPDAGQLDRGT